MIVHPEQYAAASPAEMLEAAALGRVAIDHRFLRALFRNRGEAAAAAARFASEEIDEARVDIEEDLVNIAHYLRAPEMIPFLVECVARYDDDVPDSVVEAICGFREKALEPLVELNRRIGGGEGCEVPFLLASLGVVDERIDAALAELAQRDPEEASFCAEVYREVSRGTAEPAVYDIWADYPEESDPPFEVLTPEERLEMFAGAPAELRAAIASSFFNEPDLPAAVIDALVGAAESDPDPVVRAAAWRSLAIEYDNEELRKSMLDRLQSPDLPALERAGLVVALAPAAGEGAARQAVLATYELPETRSAALEAMWRSGDASFAGFVTQSLDEADWEVREQAVMGVGYLGLVGELGRLKVMFEDPNLRPAALMAYSLAMPSEVTPARMRSLFQKIEQMAGGLEPEEADIVHLALDQRLAAAGKDPMFGSAGGPVDAH